MELLKIIIVITYTMFLYYRVGVLFEKIFNIKEHKLNDTILYGFILNFAVFEIINIPFIILNNNTTKVVYMLFIMMNIIQIVLSYLIKPKQENYNFATEIKKFRIKKDLKNICLMFAILLIGFQVLNSAFLFKQDADDSFYISWANEASNLESMYDRFPDTGIDGTKFDRKYILNTWEIYGGFTARLFRIKTPTLFHTAYPIIYIVIAYMSYYTLLKSTCKKENLNFALLMLALLFMYSGVGTKVKGVFLLGRIYQGKSILLNIILPLTISEFLKYKNFDKRNYIKLSLIYIAAIAMNPITVWFLSIIYGLFMILMFIRKDFKTMKKSMLLLIPIFILSIIYVLLLSSNISNLETIMNPESFNWLEELNNFIGSGKVFIVLYIISIFIIIIKGNEIQKNLAIIIPLLLVVLVINPILKDIYIKLITSATYWRLYWLVPLEISIVIAMTIIYDSLDDMKQKKLSIIFFIIIIIISGKYVYREELGFSKFENLEKISQYIIDETYYIEQNSEDKTIVVAPIKTLHSCTMRQYSTKILLMNSRDAQNSLYKEYEKLYSDIYNSEETNYNTNIINNMIEQCEVDWIILPKTKKLEISDKDKFEISIENGKDYILKAKRGEENESKL